MVLRSLQIVNESPHTLVPYPIVQVNGKATRMPDLKGAIAPGATATIDAAGTNPCYFAEAADGPVNGVYVDIQAMGRRPRVTVKRYRFHVPPGQAGRNKELEPRLVRADSFLPDGSEASIHLDPALTPQWVEADTHAANA